MIESYVGHRELGRQKLLARLRGETPLKPEPEKTYSLFTYLHHPEIELQEDTQALYEKLAMVLGMRGLGAWITSECPWLNNAGTPLLRVWWMLQNKYDELFSPYAVIPITEIPAHDTRVSNDTLAAKLAETQETL